MQQLIWHHWYNLPFSEIAVYWSSSSLFRLTTENFDTSKCAIICFKWFFADVKSLASCKPHNDINPIIWKNKKCIFIRELVSDQNNWKHKKYIKLWK